MLDEQSKLRCLDNHGDQFSSHDLDEARYQISNVFKPHDLDVLGKEQSLDVKLGWTNLGDTSFIYLRHGAEVNIYPGKLDSFFLVQIPINGTGHVRVDNTGIDINTDMAYAISPTVDVNMTLCENCEHLILRIERARLESFLEQHLQRNLTAPLEFLPNISLNEERNQGFIKLIIHIARQLNQPSSSLQHAMVRPQAESLLMSTMLISLAHNYHAELTAEVTAPRPYYIKKALEFIQANIENTVTPEDVANYSCISVRSIYAGFQTYLDTTPMAYIRTTKLQAVRTQLQQLELYEASITEVALRYGFSHFGNFAASYKKLFDELPRETLRRLVIKI